MPFAQSTPLLQLFPLQSAQSPGIHAGRPAKSSTTPIGSIGLTAGKRVEITNITVTLLLATTPSGGAQFAAKDATGYLLINGLIITALPLVESGSFDAGTVAGGACTEWIGSADLPQPLTTDAPTPGLLVVAGTTDPTAADLFNLAILNSKASVGFYGTATYDSTMTIIGSQGY